MAHKRSEHLLDNKGMQVSRATDQLGPGKYLRLLNVRTYIDGSIQTRPGQQRLTSTPAADTPMHSMRMLFADAPAAPQTATLITGCGTKLYTTDANVSALTLKDSGYS